MIRRFINKNASTRKPSSKILIQSVMLDELKRKYKMHSDIKIAHSTQCNNKNEINIQSLPQIHYTNIGVATNNVMTES